MTKVNLRNASHAGGTGAREGRNGSGECGFADLVCKTKHRIDSDFALARRGMRTVVESWQQHAPRPAQKLVENAADSGVDLLEQKVPLRMQRYLSPLEDALRQLAYRPKEWFESN